MYAVYKTTNLINGNIYIGVHKTENLNCLYMGSGTLIKQAIKKYGRKNFVKEILFVFDCVEKAFEKEIKIIKTTFPKYNLHGGGNGGWEYINKNKLAQSEETKLKRSKANIGRKASEETKQKIREKALGRKYSEETKLLLSKQRKGRKHSEEAKHNMSIAKLGNKGPLGTIRSTKTKLKMSKAAKLRWKREKSQIH